MKNLDKLCEKFWDGNYMEIHKDDIPSIPSAFKGMTNGEVFETVFPHLFLDFCVEGSVFIRTNVGFHLADLAGNFERDFWDAPYKAESEAKPNE